MSDLQRHDVSDGWPIRLTDDAGVDSISDRVAECVADRRIADHEPD